jgi:hypothetical protein
MPPRSKSSRPLPKKSGGRPKIPNDQRRDVRLVVLLTKPEWLAFESEAEALGVTTVELARRRVLGSG